MQFAGINLRQSCEQRRGALLELERVAAEQRQSPRDTAFRGVCRFT